MRNFGTDLTAWRKANAIKQEYLAQMLGVSQSAVSHWERGRDVPSAQTALRLQALMSKTSRDEMAIERASISRLAGLRALYDLDGVRLLARSQGFAALWPELATMSGAMLRDDLVGEAQQMLSDGDTISGILSGDIVMASGVSVNHVDTAVDLEVFYKHRWHILFRKIGQRHVIDMSYESCAPDDAPRIEHLLRLDQIAA